MYLVHYPLLHAGLFAQQFARNSIDWVGHLFPLGHIMATVLVALVLSLLPAYSLIRFDERFVRIFRAKARLR